MMTRQFGYTAASILFLCSCTVKHEVYRVDGVTDLNDRKGIYYSLPRSQIVSTFNITRKHRALSSFCSDLARAKAENKLPKAKPMDIDKEAEKIAAAGCTPESIDGFPILTAQGVDTKPFFNGLAALAINIQLGANPMADPKFDLKLTSLATEPEPDPEQLFLVRADGEHFEDRNIEVALSELGFITSAKSTAADKGTQLAVDTVKAVGSLVSTVLFGKVASVAATAQQIQATGPIGRLFTKVNAKMNRLNAIRNEKNVLLSSSSNNFRADTFNKILSDLTQEEASIVDYFQGKTSIKTLTYPVKHLTSSDGTMPLFEFIPSCGIHEPHGQSADFLTPPQDFLCKPRHRAKDKKEVNISTTTANHAKITSRLINNHEAGGNQPQGFYYRVPAQAKITVTYGQDPLQDVLLPIPQLGAVASFPSDMNSSDILLELEYYESLGSLKKAVATNKAVSVNPAVEVLGTVESALTAREAEKSAREAKKDELAVLQREAAILEAKKNKLELEKAISELTPKSDP